MPARGILFDLDNTLVDRPGSLASLAVELGDVYAADLGDADREMITRILREADDGGYGPKEGVFARLIQDLPWQNTPEAQEVRDFWYTTFPKCTRPMAGLYGVLDELQAGGLQMGVVTNGSAASQNGKVDRLDLRSYMETVVVSESVDAKKPEPKIFELALADLGLDPADVCFVGDHPVNDIAGAAVVGLIPIWFRGSHPWPEDREPPAFQIAALEGLIPLMEQLP